MRQRLFPILSLVLMMLGCAPGNPGLFIGSVISPNDQCEYSDSNAVYFQGLMDTAVPNNSYSAVLTFNNQLISLAQSGGSGFPVMADPNIINVRSVEIEMRDLGGAALSLASGPNPITIPAGVVAIPTGDGTSPGTSVGALTIIPAAYSAELAGLAGANGSIVVSMRAIGETLGGAEVVSPEFNFPINFCTGCLVACLTDEDGANICRPSCSPGQDEVHIACDATCVAGG